jgi:hypothetical protein
MSKQEQTNNRANFNYTEHDFTPIYDTLTIYFPIENPYLFNEENIKEFHGVEKINNLLRDHFFNKKNYTQRWGSFRKHLKRHWKKSFEETMVAFYPCYSGRIILHSQKTNNHTYTKELHFYISLLGPYYSIMGIDRSEITLHENWESFADHLKKSDVSYEADHVITVSPYQEYADDFKTLQTQITSFFEGLRFVPFKINLKKIQGISIVYTDTEEYLRNTVFSALFRPLKITSRVRGDVRYGFDEWLKIKKLDESKIKQVRKDLLSRCSLNDSEISIHKIWRQISITPLKLNPSLGNLSIGMETINVIDLCDPTIIYLYTEEDKEPGSFKYTIANNEISLKDHQELTFKIKILEKHTLTLIINLKLKRSDISLKVDVAEMKCEIYS